MTYRQEYYAGEAEDRAKVLSVDERVDVPARHVRRRRCRPRTRRRSSRVSSSTSSTPEDVGPVLARQGLEGRAAAARS